MQIVGKPMKNPYNNAQILQFQATTNNGVLELKGRTKTVGRFGGLKCKPEVGCELDPWMEHVGIIQAYPCHTYYSEPEPGDLCMDMGVMGEEGVGFWWHRAMGVLDRRALCTEKEEIDWGSGMIYEGTKKPGMLPLHGISCREKEVADWLDRHGVK